MTTDKAMAKTAPAKDRKPFDPSEHLMQLREGGREYLEVKWRLAWLRDAHPEAIIVTEKLALDSQFAFFKATVTIPGGGSATGHGMETADGFADYSEKAETKALGRALAALGYGTQFCEEFADAESGRLADTPVARPQQAVPAAGQVHVNAPRGFCPDHPQRPFMERTGPTGKFWACGTKIGEKDGKAVWCQRRPAAAPTTKPEAPAGVASPAPAGGIPDPKDYGDVMHLARDRKGMDSTAVLRFFQVNKSEDIAAVLKLTPAEAWAKIDAERPDVAGAALFPPTE